MAWAEVFVPVTGVVLAAGALFLIFPRITRRGLLFGVYVGESGAGGAETLALKALWTRAVLFLMAGCFALASLVGEHLGPNAASMTATLTMLLGSTLLYLHVHRRALPLAVAAPPAVAYMTGPAPRPWPAYSAIGFALVAGFAAVVFTWLHLGEFPERVPLHFNASGRPDRFGPRSPAAIWMLPLMTLGLGVMLGLMAAFIARAKRAVRRGDGGISLAAQERFRSMMSAYLALVAILTTTLMATLSIGSVRVAIGAAETLPEVVRVSLVLLMGATVLGVPLIALRVGQGGSRLEAAAGSAPLTNGLADNARWVWGLFYVNRDDPSMFVERRWGFGYTLNFGNWRALALLVALLCVTLGLSLAPRFFR